MDILPEQTAQYIRELQALRNQRLDLVLSGGVTLENLIADLSNGLEVLYIIYRSRMEDDEADSGTDTH